MRSMVPYAALGFAYVPTDVSETKRYQSLRDTFIKLYGQPCLLMARAPGV